MDNDVIRSIRKIIRDDSVDDLKRVITRENVNMNISFRHDFENETIIYPIEYASQYGAMKCVEFLFEKMGATLNKSLFYAVYNRRITCVEYFLRAGVDIRSIKDSSGRNAVSYAVSDVNMMKFVLGCGLSGEAKGLRTDYVSALHHVICLLSEKERSLGYTVGEDSSVIIYQNVARLLIEAGANINEFYINTELRLSELEHRYFIRETIYNMNKKRSNCSAVIFALNYCFRRRGAPHDLTRHILKHVIKPTWKEERWLI
jgi:hypothetical protein